MWTKSGSSAPGVQKGFPGARAPFPKARWGLPQSQRVPSPHTPPAGARECIHTWPACLPAHLGCVDSNEGERLEERGRGDALSTEKGYLPGAWRRAAVSWPASLFSFLMVVCVCVVGECPALLNCS